MAFRIYQVPAVYTPNPHGGVVRKPQYFFDGTIPRPAASMVYYGEEPWVLVGADLPPADDATIVAQANVFAFPFNLDTQLTAGQVTGVRAVLETANLAAGWVTTADTWRSVFRGVAGMSMFWDRYAAVYLSANGGGFAPSVFIGGVTLDSTFGSLPAPVQAAMQATAITFAIPIGGLTVGTTVRVMQRYVADFFSTQTYTFNGVVV